MSEQSKNSDLETRFMANIYVKPSERTQELKFLSTFTSDTRVSFQSILISAGLLTAAVIAFAASLIFVDGAISYTWFWSVLSFICVAVLIIIYMLPYRDTQLLFATFNLAMFNVSERIRRKSYSLSKFEKYGIEKIRKNGIIEFENGDYGVLLRVSGNLSISTLPSIVRANGQARLNHLISRSHSSSEVLFISVSKSDLTRQLDYYESIETLEGHDENSEVTKHDLWRAFMAAINRRFVSDDISESDTSITQTLMIRDNSLSSLKKTLTRFETSVNSGYLSKAIQIQKPSDIEKTLSSLLSTHNGKISDESIVQFSPSFSEHNGKYTSIMSLRVRRGSNRHMSFSDVIDVIPVDVTAGVDLHMIIRDAIIRDSEKQSIIKKNASGQLNLIEDIKENGSDDDNNASNTQVQSSDIDDYNDYQLIIDSSQPIVAFDIRLVIIGDTMESIDSQIETLNVSLSQRHDGLEWVSEAGDQQSQLRDLFAPLIPSRHCLTATADVYSRMDFAVSDGLVDDKGVPIGVDVMSLTSSTSFADFDNSVRGLALIATNPSSVCPLYVHEDESKAPSMSSVMAMAASNQIVMNGNRAHHLVLNDFDYLEEGMYYSPLETREVVDTYDVSSSTLNPLQGFGDIDGVVQVFNRLIQKIVHIFNLLEDLHLSQEERALILTAVEKFYFNQGLWNADAAKYPKRTRIVDIPDPTTYPTMGSLINEFSTLAKAAARENRELRADKIDTLFSILNSALMANMSILGRHTSIKPSDALHVFYSFKNVSTRQMTQIQFLNLIEYVLWTAKKGDVVVIHGSEKLYTYTARACLESIKSAKEKGIRFIFAFDTISSVSSSDAETDNMLDMFKMKSDYYVDLDNGVDMFMMGCCQPDDVDSLEKAMNQSLSETVRSRLTSRSPSQILFHRHRGSVNNFVFATPLI